MATPNTTLTQGQSFMGGTVQFDAKTGRRLKAGETTEVQNTNALGNVGNQFGFGGAIPAGAIETKQPALTIPDIPKTSVATGILSDAEASSLLGKQMRETEQRVEQGRQTQDQYRQALISLMGQPGQGALTSQLQEQLGFAGVQNQLIDIQNKIDAKSLSNRRELESIIQRGGSADQVNTVVRQTERRQASEMADLSIASNAIQRKYDAVSQEIDRKVQLQLEDQKQRVDFVKFLYEDNKQALTRDEDRQFQRLIQQENRAYETKQKELERFAGMQEFVLKAMTERGATTDEIQRAMGSKSKSELFGYLGAKVPGAGNLPDEVQEALITAGNIGEKIGTRGFRRAVGRQVIRGYQEEVKGAAYNFRTDVDRLKNILAVMNREKLKGTLTDSDIGLLKSIGTGLDYKMTQDKFKQSFGELNSFFKRKYGTSIDEYNMLGASNDEFLSSIDSEMSQAPTSNVDFFNSL